MQQQRATRSADFETLAFVMALFGVLLIVAVVLGSPIA